MRQANLPAFEPAPIPDVRPGDVFALGRHRLMCGDATSKEDVARLFDGRKPTLVVTSPPYAKQRDYDRPIACWDSMMMGALNGHKFDATVQLLINLGVLHAKNQWKDYWSSWICLMKQTGWRHYSQYIWDKGIVAPGNFYGRLPPSFEFIFHLNAVTTDANKWAACRANAVARQGRNGGSNIRKKCGSDDRRPRTKCYQTKVPRNVIQVPPVRSTEASGHPAQMPLALASFLLRTWKKEVCIAYDPFGGSGTILLACEMEDTDGLAMEIAPSYVKLALNRWRKLHPDQRIERLNR